MAPDWGGAEAASVWERPEPVQRPAPSPLSRDRIVLVAIALADAEGLAAVSLRKVAGALDAGPMRLYNYLSTKEELLDLMADAVYGEIVELGPPVGQWRSALRELAHRVRHAALRHEWFVELLGGRPSLGPRSFDYLELSFSILDGVSGFDDIDAVMAAVRAVHAYVIGGIRSEITDRVAERTTGLNESSWQAAAHGVTERRLATGRYPTLAKVVEQATDSGPATTFDAGLDYVLDGIAGRIG